MTEHEWFACDDPKPMIDHLATIGVYPAKLKAWVLACRQMANPNLTALGWHLDSDFGVRSSAEEWARCTSLTDKVSPQKRVDLLRDIIGNPFRVVYRTRSTVCMRCQGTGKMLGAFMGPTCTGCNGLGYIAQWLPWVTSEATDLATAAYDNLKSDGTLDPVRLAILADALEEAGCVRRSCLSCAVEKARGGPNPNGLRCGCTSTDILAHLRSPGPHVRGCWAIDLFRANK